VAATEESTGSQISRPRAFRLIAIVFGVLFGLALFGFPALILGWFEGGERLSHRVHDLGGGILVGILLAVPLFAVAARRQAAPLYQVALASLGGVIAAALGTDPVWLVIGFVPGAVAVGTLLAIGGPAFRARYLRPERRLSPILAAVAVAAAVPLTAYALSMAELQRLGVEGDSHVDEHHWAQMAAMAITLALVGLLASLRMPGWLVPARCAALAAMVFGLASVVFPNYPGSAGATWGLVALIGGAVYLGAAELESRRAR
jgi:hypothetical protein